MKKHLLSVLITALFPVCAFAIDGVTLINQSTVEAAGWPYTITQPGSYKLSGNLVATSGKQAILVAASNVSIDLNGFTVSCSFASNVSNLLECIGDGALFGNSAGISDVSVRNGSVTVNVSGTISVEVVALGLSGTPNTIIEETHLEMSSSAPDALGSLLAWGANSIIRHNVMSATGTGAGVVTTVRFTACPVLAVENINNTAFNSGFTGPSCIKVNNFGF